MGLTLVAGPANAGKVALLLERYLAAIGREPVLIVPTRSDVERVERELLTLRPALLGGSIGTWDDVFERIAAGDPQPRTVATEAQRLLAARRALARVSLNGLGRSARFGGFADELVRAVSELEASLVEPDAVDGDLALLYGAYRAELDALELWDRDVLRARAVARISSELDAWHGEPVFAYGFEDLTAAEWELLTALAGRTDVTVSLPYEPGRAVFASLRTTAEDLAALADGRIEELPPGTHEHAHPAIAHVERALFVDAPPPGPPLEGAVRFLEGAGPRGALELVADEILALVRGGTPPERIAVVLPSLERWRAPLETAFGTLGVPHAQEGRIRLGGAPFGEALVGLLRYAWLAGERGDLFAYLRSPFSGLTRASVDFVEGRLRGRAISAQERVDDTMRELRGGSLPALDAVRSAESPLDAVRDLAGSMIRAAYDPRRPEASQAARADLRAHEACLRLVGELENWEQISQEPIRREDLVAALERAPVRAAGSGEAGRVAVVDLLGARTRRFDAVFVLGLEEGGLPRRGGATPFLGDEARRQLGGRLQRPDPVARDRYLFYAACATASRRLTLVREAATDEGSPREPGPFWEEVRALFEPDDVARWTRRRPLSALTWPLESAPTERERLRALAVLAAGGDDEAIAAEALARVNGWSRRFERARSAFDRPTKLRHPIVRAELAARTIFPVTELERFADCSSAWLFDRVVEPKTIDADVDAKLRGSVAHTALFRFFAGLPKELGADRVDPAQVEDAVRFMRTCLEQAVDGVRMEMTPMQRRELREGLWRDLEQVVRDEADSDAKLVPRRFEVSFGSERSAPELQRGLDLGDGLTLSGKIDRIDVDPFSARGIVQDYKAGKSAHSATKIDEELRLQIPLYMLVLRDLVGIEPLGGVYRPLAGDRKARGLLREDAREEVLAGFSDRDYRDEPEFWAQVDRARATARLLAGRLREGDVRHDPRGGECPSWCDVWPMCRVRRQ
jgi:ATP-dependent helicase/DNAse subunit B